MCFLVRVQRRQRLGREGEGDPDLDTMSDSEWEFQEDPAELVDARNRLAVFACTPGEVEPPGGI